MRGLRRGAGVLALAIGMTASAQTNQLRSMGDAAQLPSSPHLLERLNDTTLGELGLCGASNYESHVNVLSPSFRRHNVDLQPVFAASAIIDRLPSDTREFIERESGVSLLEVETFDVNYDGTAPFPSDRLILDLGLHARPHNVVVERDGVRTNRFASETERLEVEGYHAQAIAGALEDVCAQTRFGELRTITGDQYLDVLRAAASGFEDLYGESSSLRGEIRRLEAALEARIERDSRAPEAPRSLQAPRVSDPMPRAVGLEDRVALEIGYFEVGVPVTLASGAGSYTAELVDYAGRSELLITSNDGISSTIALDGNVRLAYAVDPVDGRDNTHHAHMYANPDGLRYSILAVTQDPTIVAHREGSSETFTTRDWWTTAALPHSFEGYTSAMGWDRIVDGRAPVNVTNITGVMGRSITLGTQDYGVRE